MTAQLILTIGIPGCGKSFWAEEQRLRNPQSVVVVERDLIREELTGSRQKFTLERTVTEVAQARAREAWTKGKTVIVSDTNLKDKFRREWRALASTCGVVMQIKPFFVPLEICMERNNARSEGHKVPDHVMANMYRLFNDTITSVAAEDDPVSQIYGLGIS